MISFLDKHKVLSNTQFGFRKNMSTETALLNYINYIHKQLDEYKHTISIFLDLSKAFDVIDHSILETKLEHYGFRGKFLEFLLSFIKDRQYFVHVNGINSDCRTVNIGVPQGSTLGPLLFLLYINDMISCSLKLFFSQFADDSTITYSSSSYEDAKKTIENEFKLVLEWLAANKLIININKTHFMVYTNKSRPQSIPITVNNHTINETSETKFLGVMFDNKLTWNAHIKYISQKIGKSVALLKMLKFTFPTTVLKSLYYSLVYPYFNYCNTIWGGAACSQLTPLILLQKKCVRIISKVGYLDHTNALFNDLKILKLEDIYKVSCTKFIYQCYNNFHYANFKDQLQPNSNYHSYETRSRSLIRKPLQRLHQFKNSYLNKGIEIWNSLPPVIKSSKTFGLLKFKYKAHLLSIYNPNT